MLASRWVICVLALAIGAGDALAQRDPKFVVGQPPVLPAPPSAGLKGLADPYRVDNNWAKMPAGRTWGASAGVAIDRDGKSVWFAERCDKAGCVKNSSMNPILKFDPSGKLVKSFGAGMFVQPHGIFVDGDGNVWVTDPSMPKQAGRSIGNAVYKFSPDGKLLMTLGQPGVRGKGSYLFAGPSDVAVAANGDIYVADGHDTPDNNRIVKYDRNGKYLLEWGKPGFGDNQFNVVHSIDIDHEGRVYVADRRNYAVKVFDANGKLLHVWHQFGEPSGLFIDKHDMLYVADNGYQPPHDGNWKPIPGFEVAGVRIAHAGDGKLVADIPWGEYNTIEGVAVDDAGTVYGGFAGLPGAHRFFKSK